MRAKHSLAPWFFESASLAVRDANGHVIATTGDYHHQGFHTADANGFLMAAAPDLLAACKAMWGYLYATNNPGSLPAFCREAEAAIAKAEGR